MKIAWSRRKYSEEEFRLSWARATSLKDVARRVGVSSSGGSIKIIRDTASLLKLTTEHFIRPDRHPLTLDEILIEGSTYSSSSLRQRLFKEGLKKERCESCGLTEWLGQPIPLSLDHINGVHSDNRFENLRILCMNCHAQTDTWCGKNKVRRTSSGFLPGENLTKHYCETCGETKADAKSQQCFSCYSQESHEKQVYPETHVLVKGVEKHGYRAYGRLLGTSDNGLRKLLRRRGVDPLPQRLKKVDISENMW